MDVDVLGDLVARDRRDDSVALRVPGVGRRYSYRDFCTSSYKAGNVLRYLGVRRGSGVAVAAERLPEPVLAFLGAAQLGAVTRFDPRADGVRVVLVPVEREAAFELPPESKLAVYGGSPTDPAVTHWEQEVWSENPAIHPAGVAPSDPALAAGDRTFTHGDLLAAARDVVTDAGLTADDAVAIRGSLSDPGVVAGLLAPLVAGGTVVFPDEEATCDVGVGVGVPESRAVDPGTVV
jgi:hypothetical protein